MTRIYKLPDETLTEDPETYEDAWCVLGDQVATALGPTWKMVGCNPGLILENRRDSRGLSIMEERLYLSVEVSLRIIELYSLSQERPHNSGD